MFSSFIAHSKTKIDTIASKFCFSAQQSLRMVMKYDPRARICQQATEIFLGVTTLVVVIVVALSVSLSNEKVSFVI